MLVRVRVRARVRVRGHTRGVRREHATVSDPVPAMKARTWVRDRVRVRVRVRIRWA